MADLTVYHNPRCGTSRGVLEILAAAGVDVDVVEYLKTPLSEAQLRAIVTSIDVEPAELVRNDDRAKELGITPGRYTTVDEVVGVLVDHPELLQRPVVVAGKRVVLARPKDKVRDLL